jgi:urease accessory protein
MIRCLAIATAALLIATSPVFAHLDPSHNGSLLAGVSHPLFGLDHILAMVAVGLWAGVIGGRALWIVPSAFVGTMAVGYSLSLAGIEIPFVEPAILASVVVLGVLVAAAMKLPVEVGSVLVGLFALFHGHAHGGELGGALALPFGLGFAIATALLHVVGIGLAIALGSGNALGEMRGRIVARSLGAITAAAGLVIAFGS